MDNALCKICSDIIYPERIAKRFGNDNDREVRLHQEYPDAEFISYRTIAKIVWATILDTFDIDVINPPIIIDWDKDTPVSRDESGDITNYVIAACNYSATSFGKHPDYPEAPKEVFLADYELRFYHENLIRELNYVFPTKKKKLPPYILCLIQTIHTMTHEMLHFIKIAYSYQQYQLRKDSSTELVDLYNNLIEAGREADEYQNESDTIELMMKVALGFMKHSSFVENIVPGGALDLYYRTLDDDYRLLSWFESRKKATIELALGNPTREERSRYCKIVNDSDKVFCDYIKRLEDYPEVIFIE